MQKHTYGQIAHRLRALVYVILRREEALLCSCPKMAEDELREAMRDVSIADQHVEEELKSFRDVTEERFKGFSDDEVILSTFLFSSIWHSARDLSVNSNRLGDIIGRHRPERLAKLSVCLTEGTSQICFFAALKWSRRPEPAGAYRFTVTDPKRLQKLVFGCACEMR